MSDVPRSILSFLPSGPWGAWLHPVRSYRALVEASVRVRVIEEEREVRNREIDKIMDRISDTQALLDAAREEIASLRGTLAERGVALAEAEARIRRLTAELEEKESIEKQIEEFRITLGQAEDMKRRYEKRIEILRSKLRDYEDRARINDELSIDLEADPAAPRPDAPEGIRSKSPGAVAAGLPGIPPRSDDSHTDADWLRSLDDI